MNQKFTLGLIAAGVALVSAAIGTGGGIYAAQMGLVGTNRQMNVKMVEIAVGILAKEPTSSILPIREWAADVISKFSPEVPLSAEARRALINSQVVATTGQYFYTEYTTPTYFDSPYTTPRHLSPESAPTSPANKK